MTDPDVTNIHLSQIRIMASRIVYRAVCDYVHYKKWSNGRRPATKRDAAQKELFEEARSWIYGEPVEPCVGDIDIEDNFMGMEEARALLESFDEMMSFEAACDILGWDAEWIRSRIPSLSAEDLQRVGRKHGFV